VRVADLNDSLQRRLIAAKARRENGGATITDHVREVAMLLEERQRLQAIVREETERQQRRQILVSFIGLVVVYGIAAWRARHPK
jgi:hypothetical protein